MIPWFSYIAFGAYLATLFHQHLHAPHFKKMAIVSFFIIGGVLIHYSSDLLTAIYKGTDLHLFRDAADYNYLFTRLGNVFFILLFLLRI
jgi:preprotein translocase subunit SecG